MINFYYLIFIVLIFQFSKSARLDKHNVWILPVNKVAINARNLYIIAPQALPTNQLSTKVLTKNDWHSDINSYSAEIGGMNYYHVVKHQNKSQPKKKVTSIRTDNAMDKIVGGIEVDINLYPYHVAYGSNCGGAIIHEYWIMTAGHCGKKPYIKAGTKYYNQGKKIAVKNNYIHELWSEKLKDHSFDYDYQLLELSEPLRFDENIQAIKVARMEDMVVGRIITVTGWGHTFENGAYSQVLRAVRIPIVSQGHCQNVPFPYFRGSLTPRMFCAGYPEGRKDACQGDSGGPAVAGDRLLGIISFGYGCATPGSYGVYSNVAVVRDWVMATTGMYFD